MVVAAWGVVASAVAAVEVVTPGFDPVRFQGRARGRGCRSLDRACSAINVFSFVKFSFVLCRTLVFLRTIEDDRLEGFVEEAWGEEPDQ